METFIFIIAWILLILSFVSGLLLHIINLFGNWALAAGVAIFGLLTEFKYFSPWIILVVFLLALAGELAESMSAAAGSLKSGGGLSTMLVTILSFITGAALGTILIPVPVIGSIAGGWIGVYAGTVIFEKYVRGGTSEQAHKIGYGAMKGAVLGQLLKFVLGLTIITVTVVQIIR